MNIDFKRQHLCPKDNLPLYAVNTVATGYPTPTDGSQVIQLRKVYDNETCELDTYFEVETEDRGVENVYIYQIEGDHFFGIGQDDVAVEVN